MRQTCTVCDYPLKTCVCSATEIIESDVQFLIIQHKKEAIHAKNTARLVRLALPSTEIIVTGASDVNEKLDQHLQLYQSPAVIYPSVQSIPLDMQDPSPQHDLYILLDGSWKQVFGMWKMLPHLYHLPQYHFITPPQSNYGIRHTKFDKSLSTLEAVAYTLTTVSQSSATPLLELQQTFQSFWQGPLAHRR